MCFTYRGLRAQRSIHTVTSEELDMQMNRALQQHPKLLLVTDRPTQNGDEVILDYAGFCGEEQFAGGTAENQTLVLGSGTFIPGFEEQLLGRNIGENVTVKVTFPTAYHAPELAGKEARFECVIHQIRTRTPYEMDDTFAKEVGGCDTLEQMREKMRSSMQSYADEQSEMELQTQLLQQAADSLEFTPDKDALEEAVDEQMRVLEGQLSQQGLNLALYCSFLQTTAEELRKKAYPTAEANLRCFAAVEEIARLEKLEATKEEMDEAIRVIAQQNGLTLEQLKSYYTEELNASVTRSVLTAKVMKLIRDAAEIS